MKPVTILNPAKLMFGNGCFEECIADLKDSVYKKIYLITFPQIWPTLETAFSSLDELGITLKINYSIISEPTVTGFLQVLQEAQSFNADCIVGIGGGSVLDVAKLVAALYDKSQNIHDVFGIGNLKQRSLPLICIPSTAGTGSEVSPNAILLEESENLKKGIISPFLVPDASYIDPVLTLTVPPSVTAATGLDAFTHCLEAYTNKFAHPLIDRIAIDGIKLIGKSIVNAFNDGSDIEARTDVALGSMYGGMCLGPVNTAAIHALSYPLGSEYKIAHGLSNALLLPHIMRYNLPSCVEKYKNVALELGVKETGSSEEIANKGILKIEEMATLCKVPLKLSEIDIPKAVIPELAESALTIQRLLVNNPREIALDDAIAIYEAAY